MDYDAGSKLGAAAMAVLLTTIVLVVGPLAPPGEGYAERLTAWAGCAGCAACTGWAAFASPPGASVVVSVT